jgi:hypothetical protein
MARRSRENIVGEVYHDAGRARTGFSFSGVEAADGVGAPKVK